MAHARGADAPAPPIRPDRGKFRAVFAAVALAEILACCHHAAVSSAEASM
jgi:hypothetical protein